MTTAHINRIATAVPPHDVHDAFVRFAGTLLEDRARLGRSSTASSTRRRSRTASRCWRPPPTRPAASVDAGRFYGRGHFPATAARMRLYEEHAPRLAMKAVAGLDLGAGRRAASPTSSSPRAPASTRRGSTSISWSAADSIRRSSAPWSASWAATPPSTRSSSPATSCARSRQSRVLVVNLELCSLHLQETTQPRADAVLPRVRRRLCRERHERRPDGARARPLPRRADPRHARAHHLEDPRPGLRHGPLRPRAGRDRGGPRGLRRRDPRRRARRRRSILWAVHPGGRSVLDAVERGLAPRPEALAASRSVLKRFGNMSSATVMFVLQAILRAAKTGERGCAMSFGPGLTAETMLFHKV